jgi:multiple sugar transport system permease protein
MSVFLLTQFIRSIPDEWIDAGKLETNSIFAMLRHVVLPGALPGLTAMNILVFTENWNMVDKPSLYLDQLSQMPLSTALNSFINKAPGISFAASVLFMAPVIILYKMFDSQISTGLERFKW